jgi:UDP-N-acetylmuramoyl-tripeptide--D-alanyl-D-alanine ligase
MYRHLSLNDKFVFVNLEDAIQIEKRKKSNGVNRDDADVSITSVKANPFVEVHYITISSHLIGLYNASNLYAAITIGKYFEVDENLSKRL